MERSAQGFIIVLGSLVVTTAVLASALAWGPHHCAVAFPKVIGCALGSYEGLAGGLIAAASALIAGWLAWSGVQAQVESEEKRAVADRLEVEGVLKDDIEYYAEALASIWKILDEPGLEGEVNAKASAAERKLEGVIYGIEQITVASRISSSRRMVTVLGWKRRRQYEELFDDLETLGQHRQVENFDVDGALGVVKRVSIDLESLQTEVETYFEGLFRRAGKAWSLGYTIEKYAGVADED